MRGRVVLAQGTVRKKDGNKGMKEKGKMLRKILRRKSTSEFQDVKDMKV